MIRKHRPIIDAIDHETRASLLRAMGYKDHQRWSLYSLLSANMVMHVDLINTLLHLDTEVSRKIVSTLIGKPISVLRSFTARARLPALTLKLVRTDNQRRVLHIAPVLKQPDGGRTLTSTDLYRRLGLVKPGQTLQQAFARGVTRRDIRIAVKRGWMKIEEHEKT